MSTSIHTLRILKSFVEGSTGAMVSLSRGDIVKRSRKVALEWIEAGLAEEVLSSMESMVATAKDLHVGLITNNKQVIKLCKEFDVAYHDPSDKTPKKTT